MLSTVDTGIAPRTLFTEDLDVDVEAAILGLDVDVVRFTYDGDVRQCIHHAGAEL